MFTGLVAGQCTVLNVEGPNRDSAAFGASEARQRGMGAMELDGSANVGPIALGASLAVDGVCLTVASVQADRLRFEIMGETLRCTTLGERRAGDTVNVERGVRLGEPLDGHLVSGHVDGVGQVLALDDRDGWRYLRCGLPEGTGRYVVPKGSVAIDGVSLTVIATSPQDSANPWCEVGLIPSTLKATGLSKKMPGDRVNIEADLLAKYVERLTGSAFQHYGRDDLRADDHV